MLTQYKVTLPRKGTLIVWAYSSKWALCQAENILGVVVKWGWVRQVVGKRLLKAERVAAFHGVGGDA